MRTFRSVQFPVLWMLTVVLMTVPVRPATLRVGHDAGYDYTTITAALGAAQAGDTITVVDGTYRYGPPYPETFPLVMKEGVRLVRETAGTMPVIDAMSCDRVFLCDDLGSAMGTRIEGFKIMGGYAPGTEARGGALYVKDSELTVVSCDIFNNRAQQFGGGIYAYLSQLTLNGCTIRSNTADQGGGLYACRGSNIVIDDCTIRDNASDYYGAGLSITDMCQVSMESSEITGNHAILYGGGMYCLDVTVSATHCLIADNSADIWGGGLGAEKSEILCRRCAWIDNASLDGGGIGARVNAVIKLYECVIGRNTASHDGAGMTISSAAEVEMLFSRIEANQAVAAGGGISLNTAQGIIAFSSIIDNRSVNGAGIDIDDNTETQVINCLLAGNQATEFGGAFSIRDASPVVTSCTMTSNHASDGGGALACANASPVIKDSILWGNTIDEIFLFSGSPEISWCDVEGGWSGSGTNIDADPLFVSGIDGDFYLSQTASGQSADSPCVDSGSGSAASFSFSVIDRTYYMDSLTTRTDNGSDSGQIDMGFHYDPSHVYCTELGVTIDMPATHFQTGDPFFCRVTACNPGLDTFPDIPLFVLLDVYGSYYFAPGFGGFDYYELNLHPGKTVVEVIPVFSWPPGTGSASGIIFYAGMTNHDMTDLFGMMDFVVFGWGT